VDVPTHAGAFLLVRRSPPPRTGIGDSALGGAVDVDANLVNARNRISNGVFITSTRIGDPVEFGVVRALGTGKVRLVAFDDATLTDIDTDDGTTVGSSGGSLTAQSVETDHDNDILLAALEDVNLGVVRAGNSVTGGTVTVAAGESIFDTDNALGEDIRGGQVNMLAAGDIGGPGMPTSIEVRTSTVNTLSVGGANVTAINSAVPVTFDNVLAGRNIKLRARVDTTLNNVKSWRGSVLAHVRNAGLTINDVSTVGGNIRLRTTGPLGGNIDLQGQVVSRAGNIAAISRQDVNVNAATVGSQHGDTAVLAAENVFLNANGDIARIGFGDAAKVADGNIAVIARDGDVVLTGGNNPAVIGHAQGQGDILVLAGVDLTLDGTGGHAQIGNDTTTGLSNIIVAWDQIDPLADGSGRLTMTENTAVTAGRSPNRVQLFGTRRLGNSLAAGATINGHPYDGTVRLNPVPPPGPFSLNIEFFTWDHEQWGSNLTIDRADVLPYADHFAFYYIGPQIPQDMFSNFLHGTDYDRFIRAVDMVRTLEDWLLGYGQYRGSISIDPRYPWRPELAAAGGGVNNQGAE